MHTKLKKLFAYVCSISLVIILAGCGNEHPAAVPDTSPRNEQSADIVSESVKPTTDSTDHKKIPAVVTNPNDMLVLVNKQNMLPAGYKPNDLTEPDVSFLFKEHTEKRMLRKEAATALEQLIAGARKDGIALTGVSAFRSYTTQQAVFGEYANRDGLAQAQTYSALPGTSEHQTGLAIDLSGKDGKCAVTDCFGNTPEAEWIAAHSAEYGFILRYPKGGVELTGYQYEPWHIRYVGRDAAQEIVRNGWVLEQYVQSLRKDGG